MGLRPRHKSKPPPEAVFCRQNPDKSPVTHRQTALIRTSAGPNPCRMLREPRYLPDWFVGFQSGIFIPKDRPDEWAPTMMQGISGYLPGFISVISSVAMAGAGFYAAVRPAPDQQQLATIENDLSDIRVETERFTKHAEFKESARAGSEAIIGFSQRIADNRQLILDNTTLRWTSAQQDKYQRAGCIETSHRSVG